MSKPNNIKPKKAIKFLLSHGWEFVNRKGTHCTFWKNINDKDNFCQVIDNNKTIYWKNAKQMIKKSGISEKEWLEECC